MGSKQSTSSGGASTSEETASSVPYSRDYRSSSNAADSSESAATAEERARANRLAALFATTGERTAHQAVLHHHNRQSALDSLFGQFAGVRPSNSGRQLNADGTPIDIHPAAQLAHSLPGYLLFPQSFAKCPFCSKTTLPDDFEVHVVMCLTKPQLTYNEDILTEDKGECVICLEEMLQGNQIARLPCLCIYHKICIDNWFEVNRSCPEHPSDD